MMPRLYYYLYRSEEKILFKIRWSYRYNLLRLYYNIIMYRYIQVPNIQYLTTIINFVRKSDLRGCCRIDIKRYIFYGVRDEFECCENLIQVRLNNRGDSNTIFYRCTSQMSIKSSKFILKRQWVLRQTTGRHDRQLTI